MNRWYKRSIWRNLVDMHINDKIGDFMGSFDPETYAENMKLGGMDCSEFYTGNCLGICYFPTEVGHMHRGLHGKDIVGPTLDALQARGLNRVAYFNMWCRWGFDTHPSWRLLDAAGRNSCEIGFTGQSRYGVCCPNNEEFREYIAKQIEYLCTHYDFDGLWIDMIGWFIAVCHCPSCREKYMKATGREIPKKMDWKDPDWLEFQRLRQKWAVEFMHVVDDTARACKPDVTIAYQSGSWCSGWFAATSQDFMDMSDYLGADIYGTPLTSSVICKSMSNITRNKPLEYMTSRCVDLRYHTINRSKDEMRLQVYGALAHNAAFTTIDAVNPDGTMDRRLYQMLGELHAETAPFFRYWRPDARLLCDVTLYMNYESLFDPKSADMTQSYDVYKVMMTPAASLIAEHLAYDIAFQKNLPEVVASSPVIVLNETFMLNDEETAFLRDYVANGGNLIVTGLSGMYSQQGFRSDFALAEVLGVHYIDETKEDWTYLRPEGKFQELMPAFNEKNPLSIGTSAVRISVDEDAEILARLTLPWSASTETTLFASAISNPPGIDTDVPVAVLHRFGKGRAMYLAMPVQQEACSAVREVFRNLVRFMLPSEPLLKTNAPDWLELLLYDAGEFYQLTAYNAMNAYYVADAVNVEIQAQISREPKEVINACNDMPVEFSFCDGVVTVKAGTIKSFAMFIIR
ncbi:MAG: hypothetical protein MR832_03980 [Clostridiales bacterium]|nr:hypothetical protein [Clostridiales bacterium]